MTMFNVGDKIQVKAKGIIDCQELRHKFGTIIFSNRGHITVAFEDWKKGHGGNGPSQYVAEVREFIQPFNVWHCHEDEVTLVESFTPVSKQELICKKVKYLQDKFNNRSKVNYA